MMQQNAFYYIPGPDDAKFAAVRLLSASCETVGEACELAYTCASQLPLLNVVSHIVNFQRLAPTQRDVCRKLLRLGSQTFQVFELLNFSFCCRLGRLVNTTIHLVPISVRPSAYAMYICIQSSETPCTSSVRLAFLQ